MDIGICCFCNGECNPCSQSCGRCMRALTGFSLGWNPLPDHLQYLHPEFYPDENKSSKNKDDAKELRRSKRNRKNDK